MRSLIVLLGVVAALVTPAEVLAQSCGGSGGSSSGGSSSGGSSSGGSSGSDASSSTEENPCADDSSIVGLSQCRAYGRSWDVSRRRTWSIGLHGMATQLRLGDHVVQGSASHENIPHAYRSTLGSGWVGGVTARLRAFVWRGLSVGLEGEVGVGTLDSAPTSQAVFEDVAVVGGALFLGGQVGLGNVKLAGELVGGRRRLLLSGESRVGDCVTTVSTSMGRWALRGRVALRYFMGPNASFELSGAYDVLHREATASAGFALHTRSWDRR